MSEPIVPRFHEGRLAGRIALVTGASRMRGIGRATALRLAAEGADVVVAGRARPLASLSEAEQAVDWQGSASVAEEIRTMGRRAIAVTGDVTVAAEVSAMFDRAEAEIGVIDAVVNNAGAIAGSGTAPIAELSDALWSEGISVNLDSVFYVCRVAAQRLIRAQQGGAIVNVSSIAGRSGDPYHAAYCVAKSGVITLTQQLSRELARHNIRVNCLCPGLSDTDLMVRGVNEAAGRTGTADAEIRTSWTRKIPLRRAARPSDQAAAIAFLIGPDADFITGQSLNVDGGARMN